MIREEYDLIIVGAGPAGAATALYASRLGLKILLLDKEKFPRDKVCGDAISGKSMEVLRDLDLIKEAQELPGSHIHSVVFGSPKFKLIDIPLQGSKRKDVPTGLVIPRKIFDAFMFEKAEQKAARSITGFQMIDIIKDNDHICGVKGLNQNSGNREEFYGKIIIGADGFNSLIARKTGIFNRDPNHWIVAVRQYYENVSGLENQIELHFVDEIIPGYFWIFPAGKNLANVGLGIVQSALYKNPSFNLKNALEDVVKNKAFCSRFQNATPVTGISGWNLPVASTHRKNYGNGFLLTGDAAGLIDPFTGEGIGNALISGKYAAQTAKKAIEANRFDEEMLADYDKNLWGRIGAEARTSTMLQKLGQNKFLLNLVINKAANSADIREILSGMMANTISKRKLANPLFYLKLLFS